MMSRPLEKEPEAIKSFMIWTPSLSLKEIPATSSKATHNIRGRIVGPHEKCLVSGS